VRVILASASPRRAALLAQAGVAFEVRPADVDESLRGSPAPETAAVELAQRKARAAVAALSTAERRDALVLAADTIVAVPSGRGFELLGKPADEREARAMLAKLSGTRHAVVTGVCAVRASDREQRSAFERTWVRMRTIADVERDAYAASGEWRGKAGGYAIQETADAFVTGLEEGGFDNVVGLPVGLALELLRALDAPVRDR
jgi:septum formation protein